MPLIIDENQEAIGLYSWWQQTADKKEFVVVRFLGFEKAERVEVLPVYGEKSKEISITDFLIFIEKKLIIKKSKS